MTVLCQVLLLLVLEVVHYTQGQTMFDCALRPYCEDHKLPVAFIDALSNDSNKFAQFDCYMTIPLHIVHITWFYQHFEGDSSKPGDLHTIYSNVHGNDMFKTSVAVLDLSNFTYGPVRSRLQIRHVGGMYEGPYSCAEADKDVSTRQYNGCLIVLGQGVFESCPDSFTGCGKSSQNVHLGEDVVFPLKVVFRGGGGCANQAVSKLTLRRGSQIVYSCSYLDEHCEDYPRFKVVMGKDCKLDCKYYFDVVMLSFDKYDAGYYEAEVLFQSIGNTTARSITRSFVLNLAHTIEESDDKGGVPLGIIVGPALSAIVVLAMGCVLIVAAVLLVRWRRSQTPASLHKGGVYGALPDLDELQNADRVDLEDGSSS